MSSVKYNTFHKGLNEGIEQGIEQSITRIARNMLKMKMKISDIKEATGLDEKTILSLNENE